jgi:hypothetical protein
MPRTPHEMSGYAILQAANQSGRSSILSELLQRTYSVQIDRLMRESMEQSLIFGEYITTTHWNPPGMDAADESKTPATEETRMPRQPRDKFWEILDRVAGEELGAAETRLLAAGIGRPPRMGEVWTYGSRGTPYMVCLLAGSWNLLGLTAGNHGRFYSGNSDSAALLGEKLRRDGWSRTYSSVDDWVRARAAALGMRAADPAGEGAA